SISGADTVDINTIHHYTAQEGMGIYAWTVSTGGSITAGGQSYNVSALWAIPGDQTISLNVTTTAGCTAPAPVPYSVFVKGTIPLPTITGPAEVCLGTTGHVYTTEPGKTNYLWSVSAGGNITGGGTSSDNSVTITWTTTGPQTVSVVYTDAFSNTVGSPDYNVTVDPLPVPTITGPSTICLNGPGKVYTTEAGRTDYIWTVSAGGSITAGGAATDNTVTVTWTSTGAQVVSVNYTSGGCTAAAATDYLVTVNPLPVPTITGPATVCLNSAGNVYTTEPGKTDYTWAIEGGTITSGGGLNDNTATVTWFSAFVQNIRVNYANVNECMASSSTLFEVMVNPLPVPTLSGPTPVCLNSAGNVYTTEAGMSGYIWSVTGGTITSGGGSADNTATVTWTTTGTESISVFYTDDNNCSAEAPTGYDVTVDPLPVPTISGPASACLNDPGKVYTTEPGMTAYLWTVSAGGSITSGGTAADNSVTVTWTSTGAQDVSVNYTSASCNATGATSYPVTVNPLPVPTISGPATICLYSTGNVYTTEPGKANYTWAIEGGTITSGGGLTDNTATVTWFSAYVQNIRVNYTNDSQCMASSSTLFEVMVNPLPVPTVSGPTPVCLNSTGNVYTTEAGMSNYNWTVSGGTITAGGGPTDNTATVTWTSSGIESVSISYTDENNCSAESPTLYEVTVNNVPDPALSGPTPACLNAPGQVYTTDPGKTDYIWNVTGGTITSGGGAADNTATVTWTSLGAQSISVKYTDGCVSDVTMFPVTVNDLPSPTLSGPAIVCINSTGNVYTTEAGMFGYSWSVVGGTITSGGDMTDNTATVTWTSSGAQSISVNYSNGSFVAAGCTALMPTA
ncbi:MAG: hypothetical protein WCK34_18135, partial [Bacteroidota bacterium]